MSAPVSLTTRRAAVGIITLAGALALGDGPASAGRKVSTTDGPADVTMALAATHGWAAAQPTFAGQRLVDLEVHEGKVWAGYGDYGANTGPITLAAFDPAESASEFVAAFESDTEAVYNIRTIGAEIIAPATDPRVGADFATGSPWSDARPFRATHVYDTASRDGKDLWMVGSQGRDALAWRSLDGGTTWSEELRVAPASDVADDFMRFYFAGTISGALYVQPVSHKSGPVAASMVYSDDGWSEGPSVLSGDSVGWSPTEVGQGFVFHAYGHGNNGPILYFDGLSTRQVASGYDVEVHGADIWVLGEGGVVLESADLSHWSVKAQAPSSARSLALTTDSIYVGTATSELWRQSRPTVAAITSGEDGSADDLGNHRCPHDETNAARHAGAECAKGGGCRPRGNATRVAKADISSRHPCSRQLPSSDGGRVSSSR